MRKRRPRNDFCRINTPRNSILPGKNYKNEIKTKKSKAVRQSLIYDIEKYYNSYVLVQQATATIASPADINDAISVPRTTIHNLVCTCYISSDLPNFDLIKINECLPNAIHNHKAKFAAVTIRLAAPMCTVLLFGSGKLVLTGCNNYLDCVWGSTQITTLLRLHYPTSNIRLSSITIQNIVANADLQLDKDGASPKKILLDDLHNDYNINCTYSKTMFPGLIFRQEGLPVVLLIFTSGKCVITGARRVEDVEIGWTQMWPILQPYIVPDKTTT